MRDKIRKRLHLLGRISINATIPDFNDHPDVKIEDIFSLIDEVREELEMVMEQVEIEEFVEELIQESQLVEV